MHRISRAIALTITSFVFVASVSSAHAGTTKKPTRKPAQEETEPSKVRPHRGMTKGQVRKLYGDPDDQHVSSRGETWSYFFNKGHYWIPYYFGKPRTGTFVFNDKGVLTDFDYNQED